MPDEPKDPAKLAARRLRERAESELRTSLTEITKMPPEEVQTLVHELQVHAIELKLQNEELLRTQVQLAESRDRFADLYDFAPIGYLTLDASGTIAQSNLVAAEMLATDRKDLLRMKLTDFIGPEGQDAFYLHRQTAFAGDSKAVAEISMRLPDGTPRIFRLESRCRENSEVGAGEISCRTALIDITEQKRAELALLQSQERFRLAAEATGFGSYDYDPEKRRSIWSPELYAITGLPESDAIEASTILALVHPEDRGAYLQAAENALDPAGTGRHALDMRLVRPDGETRWVRDTGKTFFEGKKADRRAVRVVGTVEDITERKDAEETLRTWNRTLEERIEKRTEEVRRMSNVFRDAIDPIIIEDPHGIILDVNSEVTRLFGWQRNELIGKSIKTVVPEDHHGQVEEFLARCRKGEAVRNIEGAHLTKSGEAVPVLLTLSVLSDDGEETSAIASIAKDLRELKQTELDLLESRALAETHRDIAYMANEATNLEEAFSFCLERVALYNSWSFGHAWFPCVENPEILLSTADHYAVDSERFLPFREASRKMKLAKGKCFSGRVFASGKSEWTTEIRRDLTVRGAIAESVGVRTAVAFPILVRSKIMGVFEFFSDEIIEIDSRIEESMASIGAQIGRVIERSEAERTLKEREARLRQLTEHLRDMVWMRELDSFKVIYSNPAFEAFYGRSGEILEETPMAFLDWVHEADRDRVAAAILRLQTGEKLNETFRIHRPGGEIRWLRDRGYPVRDESGRIYRLVGTTEDITERRKAEEARKQLERQIVVIAEKERHRISRDLHDGLGGLLAAADLRHQKLVDSLRKGKPPEQEDAEIVSQLIRRGMSETRRLTRGLHPVGDDPDDLMLALKEFMSNVRAHSSLTCRFVCRRAVHVNDSRVANELFRIAQEAVNNAVKHSGADHLTLTLKIDGPEIVLTIKDDGCGIDPEKLCHGDRKCFGLKTMEFRAHSIDGTLKVLPRRKKGTQVICAVPKMDRLDED